MEDTGNCPHGTPFRSRCEACVEETLTEKIEMNKPNSFLLRKFLTHTDESGRFIVCSKRTGRKYFVEPIGDPHREWGSIDPSDSGQRGKLMHKKGDGKYRGSIDEKDSMITVENGFTKITMLEPGTSPLAYIDNIDAEYPSL